jgi:hypothetical protein
VALARFQALRVDVLESDEHPPATGARRLLDEVRDLGTRCRLNKARCRDALFSSEDHAVENRFPVLVTRKIVVGDEIADDVMRRAGPDQPLDIIGVTV